MLLLAGQIYYQLGKYQEASEQLEKASELRPGSAEIFLWLGRSLGRRAEASSIFTAPGYARRCREALEQAVALNGKHLEAMSDLATYYLEAPGFLGGGLEKAAKLASQIASLDAAAGHSVQARIAEKRQDFSGAEAHLQQAAEMAPRQIDRLIDLAKFLARRGKVQQSEQITGNGSRGRAGITEASVRARGNVHPAAAQPQGGTGAVAALSGDATDAGGPAAARRGTAPG